MPGHREPARLALHAGRSRIVSPKCSGIEPLAEQDAKGGPELPARQVLACVVAKAGHVPALWQLVGTWGFEGARRHS